MNWVDAVSRVSCEEARNLAGTLTASHYLQDEGRRHCVCAGKTVTLVEAMIQIEQKKGSGSCILACASHNKDADLICQEIVKKSPNSAVLRVYAKSVDPKHVPGDIKVSVFPSSFKETILGVS